MEHEHEHPVSHTHSAACESSEDNSSLWLPISVFAAGLCIAGAIIYVGRLGLAPSAAQYGNVPSAPTAPSAPTVPGAPSAPTTPPTTDVLKALALGKRDVVLGSPSAKVTIIEYSDYQCPFCHRLENTTMSQIKSAYVNTGKVKLVYRDYAFLGAESTAASAAAECAKDQGKFWPFHDALMAAETKDGQENSGNLTRDLFVSLAKAVGINEASFAKCVDSGTYTQLVAQNKAAADAVGVNGTPKTFINGEAVSGAQPFEAFDTLIKKYL